MTTSPTTTTGIDPHVTGRGLLLVEASASEVRLAILREIVERWRRGESEDGIVEAVRDMVAGLQPVLAEAFVESDLTAWLAAFETMGRRIPQWLRDHLADIGRSLEGDGPPNIPPVIMAAHDPLEPEREVRFPLIERAAESLLRRGLMTRAEFVVAAEEARRQAFTVAGDLTQDAVGQVRDSLAILTDRGTSLREFRREVQDRLQGGLLGPAHVENVYRTNTQAAFRDGRETLLARQVVSDAFPYQMYAPIRDARARPHHLALGTLGLDGTGIYRRDDPFWDRWTPPCGYNCRCAAIPMTLEQAAARGVREAREWLQTGRPPVAPEWRYQDIPFAPEPGFGHRRGVMARAA